MFAQKSIVCTLGTLSGLFLMGITSPASLAQTSASDLQPWEGGGQTDAGSSANDPLGTRDGTGAGSLFELLNRIQLLQGQSGAEFARNQEKQFNTAVEDFQKKQQEAFEDSEDE